MAGRKAAARPAVGTAPAPSATRGSATPPNSARSQGQLVWLACLSSETSSTAGERRRDASCDALARVRPRANGPAASGCRPPAPTASTQLSVAARPRASRCDQRTSGRAGQSRGVAEEPRDRQVEPEQVPGDEREQSGAEVRRSRASGDDECASPAAQGTAMESATVQRPCASLGTASERALNGSLRFRSASANAKLDSDCATRSSSVRILLVEDDAALAGAVCSYLTAKAFVVDVVARPRRGARRAARRCSTRAVLLDLHLSDGDGLSLLPAVRALRERPIVIVADRARPGDRPHPRPRRRRRRLPHQALRPGRAAGPPARGASAARSGSELAGAAARLAARSTWRTTWCAGRRAGHADAEGMGAAARDGDAARAHPHPRERCQDALYGFERRGRQQHARGLRQPPAPQARPQPHPDPARPGLPAVVLARGTDRDGVAAAAAPLGRAIRSPTG